MPKYGVASNKYVLVNKNMKDDMTLSTENHPRLEGKGPDLDIF